MVRLPQPVLTNTQLDILCNIRYKGFKTKKLAMTFGLTSTRPSPLPLPVREGSDYTQAGEALRSALDNLCKEAEACVDEGVNYIILTDKIEDAEVSTPLPHREGLGEGLFFIPSLLAVSAVHHHLISVGKRVQTALIVESGEIREVMHAALLLGYGARHCVRT